MEKQARTKGNKILKYLQRPASFSIFSGPFSPGRTRRPESSARPKPHHHNSFSGPLVLAGPAEARTRQKSGGFDAPEPMSPKVSCIGQIKQKKANRSRRKSSSVVQPADGRPPFSIGKMFQRKVRPGRRSESDAKDNDKVAPSHAPVLGQMRRFASGRDSLAGFDWKKAMGDGEPESDEEEEVIIPHSAPIVMGGGKPGTGEVRKEVNLWKRRTVVPPLPLHLD